MKKIVTLLLVLVLAVTSFAACGERPAPTVEPSQGATQEPKTDWSYIQDKGTFVLGFDQEFPPMGFVDDNGDYAGFDIDVAKECCKSLGVELVLQPINWDTKELELFTKNIDCIWNGFTITDERKNEMNFSQPYMNNKQVVVVKKSEADNYTSKEDMVGKKIAVQTSSAALDLVLAETILKNNKPIEIDSNVQILNDIKNGIEDVAVMDSVLAGYAIENNKALKESLTLVDITFSTEKYGIAFRKDSDAAAKLDKVIAELYNNGKMVEIANKYGLADSLTQE